MKLKYINAIRANLIIHSNQKTINQLDGTYKSVYRGKSMNFECLREYSINDDVKDIDWKSSARNQTLLVKQFVAEKKHNIVLLMDSGIKMLGDSIDLDEKKEVATYIAGTIGYLAVNNGDYVGMIYNMEDNIIYNPFKNNLYYLEQFLTFYERDGAINNCEGLNKGLKYLSKNIHKRVIVFIITDLSGLEKIDQRLLKEISACNDVLLININDAFIFGKNLYDVENNYYIPQFVSSNKKIKEIEINLKQEMYEKYVENLKKMKIDVVSINGLSDINFKIIELLERHKYASVH